MCGLVATANLASAVQYSLSGEPGDLVMGLHTIIPGYENGYSFYVGPLSMTTSDPGWANPLNTYCTDVGTFLTSPHEYTPYTIPPAQLGVNPTWVSGGIQKAAALFSLNNNAISQDYQRAGLQLAIWEILYNTEGSYAGTDFFNNGNNGFYIQSADSGDTALAANYAAAILNQVLALSPSQLAAADSRVLWLAPTEGALIQGSQGLLYKVPDLASTFVMFAMALTALGMADRKLRVA
jgi:hypothetical protein